MNILRWWTDIDRGKTEVLRNKTVPLPLCPPQDPKGTGVGLSWCIGSIHDDMVMRIPECTCQYLNPIHTGGNHLTESAWFNNPRACVNICVRVVPRARVTAYVWLTFSICELGFIIYRCRWKSNQICQQPVTEAFHIDYREDIVMWFMARVHKFWKKIIQRNQRSNIKPSTAVLLCFTLCWVFIYSLLLFPIFQLNFTFLNHLTFIPTYISFTLLNCTDKLRRV